MFLCLPIAQTQAQHVHPNVAVIDGAEHPEQILEGTAWRLYFLNITQNDFARWPLEQGTFGLSAVEILATSAVLRDFRQAYDQAAATYNASPQTTADWTSFVDQRNTLLAHARAQLGIALRAESMTRFADHIEKEKATMATQEGADVALDARQDVAGATLKLASLGGQSTTCSLHPGYSFYAGYSASGPTGGPFTVSKSATLEGSTVATPATCNAFHTPAADIQFGGTWSNNQTGAVPMRSYIDLADNPIVLTVNPGEQIGDVSEATVYCTAFRGNIYSSTSRKLLEYAETWTKASGTGSYIGTDNGIPEYYKPVTAYCTNGTPDYNPSNIYAYETNSPTDIYFPAHAWMWRLLSTSTWGVLLYVPAIYGYADNNPPLFHSCTHTGPQQ